MSAGQDDTLDGGRKALVKLHLISREAVTSQALGPPGEEEQVWKKAEALEPPYDPGQLCGLLEHSSILRQNVDAYVNNIDGFGHRFEPVVDLDADDADEKIRHAIYLERMEARAREDALRQAADVPGIPPPGQAPDPEGATEKPLMPTDAEVQLRKEELRSQMWLERSMLEHFFEFCCPDISFVTLRRRTRQDLEVIGNAYWEVVRDLAGRIVRIDHVPGFTVRARPMDAEAVTVEEKVKVSAVSFTTVKRSRRFRRYVQAHEDAVVFFREFGDPRVVSRKTGRAFETLAALLAEDETDGPATEILHFKVHSPRSAAYGVPRWIGALLAVMGGRAAEEVNYLYFDNKTVPPLAILVSGGHITDGTADKLRDFIKTEVKGRRNFHSLMVLEAEPFSQDASARCRIELKPLTDAQQKDALFLEYGERNNDLVGQSFRLPRLLRGDIRDFNRATADAALEFTEMQVFGPERDEFDFIINRRLLPDLGAGKYRFRSNAASVRNPTELTAIVTNLTDAGILTPEEGRQLAEGILNRDLRRIDAPWVKQPIKLTLAAVPPPAGEAGGVGLDLARATPVAGASIELTPTDRAAVITVAEIRAACGLGPLLDDQGNLVPGTHLPVLEFQEARRAGRGIPAAPPGDVMADAKRLIALRHALALAEAEEAQQGFIANMGGDQEPT